MEPNERSGNAKSIAKDKCQSVAAYSSSVSSQTSGSVQSYGCQLKVHFFTALAGGSISVGGDEADNRQVGGNKLN